MAFLPASKRRRLTPPTSEDAHLPHTMSALDTTTPAQNAFYKQAASWNLEQDYESRPRKEKKQKKESTRLPIKTAEGRLLQLDAPGDNVADEDSDLEWLGASDQEDQEAESKDEVPAEPELPLRQQILDAKEDLARIALMLNEEPEENAGAFKALAQIGQSKHATIKKLALATQLTVYKDVIPGYRIRPLSEADMEAKVSKDVRRVRAYEQALVGSYQIYIKELAALASSSGDASLCSLAISCACALLLAVPHFNFRGELLKILVGKLSTKRLDADFAKCRETIEQLFSEDDDGTPSLDAVSLLAKMMKARNYRVDESVLNTFLHLRLLSEFSGKASTTRIDRLEQPAASLPGKSIKQKKVFRTKKERKAQKERKAVEKEMTQADATVSHEERDRMQSETLKLVFVTYFRILKLRLPKLMGAVLEGLARYAHLINQQFFGDLLEALKDLIGHAETGDDLDEDMLSEDDMETRRDLTREALLCTITAFALLEGQDAHKAQASLSLDLSFFITHLYRHLYALALDPEIELSSKTRRPWDPEQPESSTAMKQRVNVQTTTVLLIRSLQSVLLPPLAARAVPPLRIAAFTKQLMTSCLQLPERSSLAMLGLLETAAKVQGKKVAGLWHTEERRGDGAFNGLHTEVEGSNPFAATVWEGELLRVHYCPVVREAVKAVEHNIVKARQ